MFNFLRSPTTTLHDVGQFLKVDMHSHILPGIDDGAADIDKSLFLIDNLLEMGYEKLIATPHVLTDHHPNTSGSIRFALGELQEALDKRGYTVPVSAAAEYMLDEEFYKLLDQDERLLTLHDDYLLVEVNYLQTTPSFETLVFELQTKGYKVVLAHPERYHFVDGRLKLLHKYKAKGIYLQPNLLSFTGYYGKREAEIANRMLENGLVDFIGTDLHHTRHVEGIKNKEVKQKIKDLMQNGTFKNTELL